MTEACHKALPLSTEFNISKRIDFSDCEIFDSATVLTNILSFKKSNHSKKCKAIRFTRKDQNRIENLENIFKKEFVEHCKQLLQKNGFILFNTMILDEAHNVRNRKYISEINQEFYTSKMLPRIEVHNELIIIEKQS